MQGSRRSAVRVLDFSPGGVSLPTQDVSFDLEDEPLSLRIGEREIPCSVAPESGERLRASPRSGRIGLALEFETTAREDVALFYHRLRFPSLVRRSEVPGEEIRNLLRDSGYMALRPGLEPDGAWLRAEWPTTLSHEAVFREDDTPALGHIAITRAYRNSWIGHEIAMLRRTSDNLRCRRDLYQHFCVWPRLVDGDGTYVFGYYSPKRRFHQEMFEAFASRSAVEECVVVRMERYMRSAEWPQTPDGCLEGFTVTPMTADEEPQVLAMLEAAWPALARDALDIGPGRLSQGELHPEFAVLGGQRARQCLIMRSGNRLVAALLCEWEDTRLSLFDALSIAHVFLAPGVDPDSRIENAITTVLRDFYTARGANIPLFTCPPGSFGRRDVPGFKWVETMGCIVFSARALCAFESFVDLSLELEPVAEQAHAFQVGS